MLVGVIVYTDIARMSECVYILNVMDKCIMNVFFFLCINPSEYFRAHINFCHIVHVWTHPHTYR